MRRRLRAWRWRRQERDFHEAFNSFLCSCGASVCTEKSRPARCPFCLADESEMRRVLFVGATS